MKFFFNQVEVEVDMVTLSIMRQSEDGDRTKVKVTLLYLGSKRVTMIL